MVTELRTKMNEDMILRGYSPATRKLYIAKVHDFARYHGKSPAMLGDFEIREYLLHLVRERNISASAFKHALCGLKILYEITLRRTWHTLEISRPKHVRIVPVVLSKEEVKRILDAITNLKHRAIITTIYSAGLRLSEVCQLKVQDIDSARMMLRINQSKFNRDRYVMLGQQTLALLREYWREYRPRDWLFSGKPSDSSISPRSVQRIFELALKKTGIGKRASVHTLRHSCATHLMESGIALPVIQILLGHASAATTAIYTHISWSTLAAIKSPIDTL